MTSSPGTGSAAWYVHDTAGHRFIVQWDSFRYRYSSSTIERFQVVIYDTTLAARDGNNEFVYQYATANWIQSSTIGIQDPTPSIGITVIYDATRNRAAAPIYARRAIKFTTDPPIVGVLSPESRISNLESGIFSAFPNPFTGTTTIRVPASSLIAHHSSLSVYDAQGRLVRSSFVISTSSFRLDLRSMPAGLYFARLCLPDRTATLKLIRQR